jgi:hypothetical protein
LDKFNEHADNLEESGFFEKSLSDNIKWCSWNMAWYHVNKRFGYNSDRDNDRDGVNKHCGTILGNENVELNHIKLRILGE